MKPVLVDSNVLLDIATNDPTWSDWSAAMLERLGDEAVPAINALVYAEVSIGFPTIEGLEAALPGDLFRREDLPPHEAAFLAGKCFLDYRRGGGTKRSPLPDFYIGAHAAVADYRLLTRERCPAPHVLPAAGGDRSLTGTR